MPTVALEAFKPAYETWVRESLADYRAGNLQEIIKRYPFVESTDIPWTPYTGDPATQTFGLVTSGGLFLKQSQAPFDTGSIHGDPSYREIPKSVRPDELDIAHAHYDQTLAREDINIIFPCQRFLELESEGVIGRVAETHYSLGYVNDVATLVEKTIPELLERIRSQGIEVLLLVPV